MSWRRFSASCNRSDSRYVPVFSFPTASPPQLQAKADSTDDCGFAYLLAPPKCSSRINRRVPSAFPYLQSTATRSCRANILGAAIARAGGCHQSSRFLSPQGYFPDSEPVALIATLVVCDTNALVPYFVLHLYLHGGSYLNGN